MKFKTIIGLEIHLELNTKTKLFCDCPNKESKEPNLNICPICMAHPGCLPVLNKEAVRSILKLGLALNGKINEKVNFDRKNYFYPDLPKGYQISQYDLPFIKSGRLILKDNRIELERIHLEEDTAKIFHKKDKLLLDFNRAGIPLIELVTRPVISSSIVAKNFLKELQRIVRYLEISNANMEKGEMRCDANISLQPEDSSKYFPKTEVKNLNSFKSVEKALKYEMERQKKCWEKDEIPKQATRGWHENKQKTILQRSKEAAKDYCYFPEPNLPSVNVKKMDINLDKLKSDLPELPEAKRKRFIQEYNIRPEDASILIKSKNMAHYTEKVISELKAWLISLETVEGTEKQIWKRSGKKLSKLVCNWLINHLLTDKLKFNIDPENFAEFIIFVYEKKTPNDLATKILKIMDSTGKDIDTVLDEYDLESINEKSLQNFIDQVIKENPKVIEKYKNGQKNVIKFLIGQVMKKSQGKADPEMIEELLYEELD